MKDIVTFIKEQLEVNESKEKFVTFTLYGCDDSKKAVQDIADKSSSKHVYVEKIDDNTFKVKVKEGQDVAFIVDKLNELIDSIPEDKQEELQSKTESIKKAIEKLQNAVETEPEEEKKEEKKEEE